MNTFIISSKNLERGKEEALLQIKQAKINRFDIELLEFEKALGIEDVRRLQQKVFLKPFQGDKKAVLAILPAGATTEAQNSMLKLLEEPPQSTLIFFVIENHQHFITTILSRAKVIEIKQDNKPTSGELSQIQRNGALVLSQNIAKNKEQALGFLEGATLGAREEMIENLKTNPIRSLELHRLLKLLSSAYYDLKNTNVNSRLLLENLFLSAGK